MPLKKINTNTHMLILWSRSSSIQLNCSYLTMD